MPAPPQIIWEDAYSYIEPQINAEGIHHWAFDPGFPIDVRFFTFAQRNNIRLNRHDYFELLFLHSGGVSYQIQDRFFPMRKGDLILISGTQYHRMAQFQSPRLRAASLYFLPDLIRPLDSRGEEMAYLMPFLVQDANFPHVVAADTGLPRQVFDLMKRIQQELPAQSRRGRLSVRTYLKMMLVLLVNHFAHYQGTEEVFQHRQNELQRLRPLFEYLDLHYGEPLTVEDAASLVNMSKSHFMRFFRQVTGQSFIDHLHHFRIAKAQALMANPNLSIAEISQEVGFCDQSYFGMVFRKLLNMTPRQFKEQMGKPGPSSE
jgi:AraC-like DNA-binding protein